MVVVFIFGAACGLVVGVVFGHSIWTWAKNKVENNQTKKS